MKNFQFLLFLLILPIMYNMEDLGECFSSKENTTNSRNNEFDFYRRSP